MRSTSTIYRSAVIYRSSPRSQLSFLRLRRHHSRSSAPCQHLRRQRYTSFDSEHEIIYISSDADASDASHANASSAEYASLEEDTLDAADADTTSDADIPDADIPDADCSETDGSEADDSEAQDADAYEPDNHDGTTAERIVA